MLRRTALSLLALLPFGAKAAVAPHHLLGEPERKPLDTPPVRKPNILSVSAPDDDTREIMWEVDHDVGHYEVILEFDKGSSLMIRRVVAAPHQTTLRCLLTGHLATGPHHFAIKAVSKSGAASHTTSWPNGPMHKAEYE